MLTPTQEKIHKVAKAHFLKDGFQKASLRKIVAESGFTSGAFYGYYDSKEELFDALVRETAEGIERIVANMSSQFEALPAEQAFTSVTEVFSEGLPELADYLLANVEEVRLLLKCSEGTRYENFMSAMMDQDLDYWVRNAGDQFPLSPLAANLLVNSYFNLLGDAVLSGATREQIITAMRDINAMYTCGMIGLMKGKTEQ